MYSIRFGFWGHYKWLCSEIWVTWTRKDQNNMTKAARMIKLSICKEKVLIHCVFVIEMSQNNYSLLTMWKCSACALVVILIFLILVYYGHVHVGGSYSPLLFHTGSEFIASRSLTNTVNNTAFNYDHEPKKNYSYNTVTWFQNVGKSKRDLWIRALLFICGLHILEL